MLGHMQRFKFDNVTKVTLVYFCTRFHFYIHAYALILIQRGLSLLQISAIESLVILITFFADTPTGILADRLGRKWSILLGVAFLASGETLFLFSKVYPLYLVVAVLTGLGFAFSSGATDALIYDSLPVEGRAEAMKRVMGRYNSAGQIAFFLSPIIGGLLLDDLAPERVSLAIIFTVTSLVIGILISLTLHEPPTAWHSERQSIRTIVGEGWNELRSNYLLRRVVLLAIFSAPFTGPLITTLAPPYLVQNGVPTFWVGLALSLGSLMAAFTQANVYRLERWIGERGALLLATLLPGAFYLLLSQLTGALPVWLLITLMYGTNDLRAPLLSAHENVLISGGSRATVLSMINTASSLFIAVMEPVYAALATHSLPLAFVTIGSVIGIAALVFRLPKREQTPVIVENLS